MCTHRSQYYYGQGCLGLLPVAYPPHYNVVSRQETKKLKGKTIMLPRVYTLEHT